MANTRFASRNYQIAPAPVSGYPLFDEFSIVVAEGTTNYVANPSAEIDLTGYGNLNGTIARTSAQQRRGVYSILATPSAANQIGGVYYDLDLVEGQTYTLSADFLGAANLEYAFILADPDETITGILAGMWKGIFSTLTYSTSYPISENIIAQKRFRARGCWERPSFVFASDATDTRRLYIVKTSTSAIGPFYTDGWQVEAKAYPTTYADGDQRGFLRDELAYYWTGAAHASTSIRSASTRSGGKPVSLKSMGFTLMAFLGLGMGIVVNRQTNLAYGGSLYEGSYEDNRTFSLVGRFDERSWERLQEREKSLRALVNFQVTPDAQPVLLHYMPNDGCKDLRCTPVEIVASYDGGLEGNTTNLHNAGVALSFVGYRGEVPNIADGGNAAAELDFSETFASTFGVMERANGFEWRNPSPSTTNGLITSLAYYNQYLYAVGTFTVINAVSANRVARWDGSSWSALGVGLNGRVDAIVTDPQGNVYVGGQFTTAGGGAASRVAKWDGSAWSALGTGANSDVDALALDPLGNLYAGGTFTTMGGVGANRVAKWNGSAWSALGTGLDAGVNAITIAPNGTDVYVGGVFSNAGGSPAEKIARWNGSAWFALGAGVDGTAVYGMAFGPDGYLSVVGRLAGALNGVLSSGIIKWNGTNWAGYGVGLTNPGGTAETRSIVIDQNGVIYVGGSFTTAGTVLTVDGAARWTGSTWAPIDLDLPGSVDIYSARLGFPNKLAVSYNSTGTAKSGGLTTVTNNGTAAVSPKVVFTGPGRLIQLVNTTTGRAIYFNLTLAPGETATLVLGSAPTFTSNVRGSVIGYILPGSQLTTWKLIPEDNVISAFVTDTNGDSAATMEWKHGFFALGDAVN